MSSWNVCLQIISTTCPERYIFDVSIKTSSETPIISNTLEFFCLKKLRVSWYWRTLHVCTPSQKLNTIRISVLRDIIRIWKKSTTLKMSQLSILHNNNPKKLLTNCQKKNCPINNQVKFIWNGEKERLPDYLLKNYFFYQFVNDLPALFLYRINLLGIFGMGEFLQIFIISRSTEVLIESNFWLGMCVPYILNRYSM